MRKRVPSSSKVGERIVDEKLVREVVASCDRHFEKYGFRKMSLKQLDELCGL